MIIFILKLKLVIQRVNFAQVDVNDKIVGKIDKGLLIFLGISSDCSLDKLEWMVDKVLKLRLWESEKKGFDLSVKDICGDILVVSQFTLFGDYSKGTKPNFSKSAQFDIAKEFYDKFIWKLKEKSDLRIENGEFGAMMNVKLENDGPVTVILEK